MSVRVSLCVLKLITDLQWKKVGKYFEYCKGALLTVSLSNLHNNMQYSLQYGDDQHSL